MTFIPVVTQLQVDVLLQPSSLHTFCGYCQLLLTKSETHHTTPRLLHGPNGEGAPATTHLKHMISGGQTWQGDTASAQSVDSQQTVVQQTDSQYTQSVKTVNDNTEGLPSQQGPHPADVATCCTHAQYMWMDSVLAASQD